MEEIQWFFFGSEAHIILLFFFDISVKTYKFDFISPELAN